MNSYAELPRGRSLWDCHQHVVEGRGEGEGLNIARMERKIRGTDTAQSFCKTFRVKALFWKSRFSNMGLPAPKEGDRT